MHWRDCGESQNVFGKEMLDIGFYERRDVSLWTIKVRSTYSDGYMMWRRGMYAS